ncbi:glycosyltransferase family 2 protein [Aphanothece sacrum]|uniref:Glycosyl transferase n=1 Tax=Aphanothece sacrum FPU1 TaxID=1920663 RepID=A0A401IJ24_APHSA|nr:glycosyltransferase family 2 protein [Aphanothece sacrum]GBF81259.1 glycosyl transferase [Aphanothece sacrum FPU1]GBF83391.1 glycosyl transferase [Aphanothece sacrum FPU3]
MISVITPVYNGEKFIESCLKVVIEQNCADVEHIIVDGGSKDRTVEIIEEYAEKYPHIRWISEPDQGQSDAMNKGIKITKGEIISFLNVDDFYEPNVLNRAAEIFKSLPDLSFLVGNCNILGDNDQIINVQKPAKLRLKDLLRGFMINPPPVNPSAYFYHKSIHEKAGLYDVDEHYVMDNEFFLRAIKVAKIKYIDETWGNFRHIPGTKSYYYGKVNNFFMERYNKLLKQHIKELPFFERLPFYWEWSIDSKIKYFYRHPQELLPSLIKKINSNQ